MNDIHEIKSYIWYNFEGIILYIIFILLISILWFFYKKYKNKIIDLSKYDYEKIQEIDFLKLLNNLKSNYLKEKNQLFYTNFKKLIVLYLETKTKKSISKMTLSEIDKLDLDDWFKWLLRDVYFKQYSKNAFTDWTEYRNKLLDDFEKMLKTEQNNNI